MPLVFLSFYFNLTLAPPGVLARRHNYSRARSWKSIPKSLRGKIPNGELMFFFEIIIMITLNILVYCISIFGSKTKVESENGKINRI